MKSCKKTAVNELRPDETVLKAALYTHAMKSPGIPWKFFKRSKTKYGKI